MTVLEDFVGINYRFLAKRLYMHRMSVKGVRGRGEE